jgi:hypothetical protein
VAKKRQSIYGDPIPSWRYLDNAEKFRVLLNHFETVNEFSLYSKIPLKSIWGYVNALDRGLNIKPDKFNDEIKRSRKLMNSRVNRFKKTYEGDAPVLDKTLFLRPYHPKIINDLGQVFQSDYVHYRTEHLTWPEILSVLREVFKHRIFTGYRIFRMEYVAVGALYLEYYDNYAFNDDQLQKQYQLNGVIKLSTEVREFSEPWGKVLDQANGLYHKMKIKGMLRITSIAFSSKGGKNEKRDTKQSLKRK